MPAPLASTGSFPPLPRPLTWQRVPSHLGCQRQEAKGKMFPKWPWTHPGPGPCDEPIESGPGRGSQPGAKGWSHQCLLWKLWQPAISGLVPYLPLGRWQEQRSENKDGSRRLQPHLHPHTPSLLAPHCSQTEVGGWSQEGPGAQPALPPRAWLPGKCGKQKGLPMFPLLIRPPLLLRVCHHRPITPPEPSAPQHLWGGPGGALAARAEAQAGSGASGRCWGPLPG